MKNFQLFFLSCAFTISLVACGGGGGGGGGAAPVADPLAGYSGSRNQATVDEENVDELSKAAVEAAQRSGEYDSIESNLPLRSVSQNEVTTLSSVSAEVKNIMLTEIIAINSGVSARVEDVSSDICFSGTAIANFPDNQPPPQNGSASFTFSSCDVGGVVFDGSATITWNGYDVNTDEPINFTVSVNLTATETDSDPVLVTASLVCTNRGASCSFNDPFTEDNIHYAVENVTVTGNEFSGYNVTARVYQQDFGYIDITASNIVPCDDGSGNIRTGSIEASDSNGSEVFSVSFQGDCQTYLLSYGGVSNTYNQ